MSHRKLLIIGSLAFIGLTAATVVHALDEEATLALMKKSNCFKCHAVDKQKVGSAFKNVAKKYQGNADAEQKLYTHLTEKIDPKEGQHEILKTKNEADVRSVVKWILAR